MARQSITFTPPNDDWLKSQLESQEYSSKSEVVNALIRDARKKEIDREMLVAALVEGEQSGMSERSADDIIRDVLKRRSLDDAL